MGYELAVLFLGIFVLSGVLAWWSLSRDIKALRNLQTEKIKRRQKLFGTIDLRPRSLHRHEDVQPN